MKKLLFIALAALFLFSSCVSNTGVKPKINSADTIFIKGIQATFNGITENFNTNDSAQYFKPQSYYATYMRGKDNGNTFIQIEVFSKTGPIPVGTYTSPAAGEDPDIFPTITYQIYSNGYFYRDDITNHAYPITITITSTTATNVKGAFSGTLVSNAGPPLIITNGKFDIDIDMR